MNGKDILFMRSTKKKNKVGSDSTMAEDDVWDDSLLVEAYNKAIDYAHANVLKNMPNIPPKLKLPLDDTDQKKQWKVGDYCRCEFTEDHLYYEASIIDIIDDLDMCVVKYVGYENEERVYLSKLKPSMGENARTMQIKQAAQEKVVKNEPSDDKQLGSNDLSQSGKKKNISAKQENIKRKETALSNGVNIGYPSSSHMFKPPVMGVIPPPPPPQMFTKLDDNIPESDAMSAMLMAWYMSGYHTGYYQGLKASKK